MEGSGGLNQAAHLPRQRLEVLTDYCKCKGSLRQLPRATQAAGELVWYAFLGATHLLEEAAKECPSVTPPEADTKCAPRFSHSIVKI